MSVGMRLKNTDYTKYKGYARGSAQLIAVLPPSVTTYEDFDVFCQAEKTYRIEAIKANDVLASWSNIRTEAPLFEGPTEPMDLWLATVASDAFVELQWGLLPDIPFAKELVIEKNSGGGFFPVYKQAASDLIRGWIDENVVVHDQSYTYRAFVVDSCGEQTPAGLIAKSIHLTAERQAGRIFLNWNPYQEWETGIMAYELEVFE